MIDRAFSAPWRLSSTFMSTMPRNEALYDLPLEVIDEIISSKQDDSDFLRSVSLVSRSWRAVALRYLFSTASFLCKNDFFRWRLIGASLPHVAQYVRKVVFKLGITWTIRERASSAPTGFLARAQSTVKANSSDYSAYRQELLSALDCTFPKDCEFEGVAFLPIMSNATSLDWATPFADEGFHPTSALATRFLESFPNITRLSYSTHLLRPEVQEHFMSFFQSLRNCTFSLWRFDDPEPLYAFNIPESRLHVSQLEEIWFDECEPGSMDWLVDDVPNHSRSHIRKLGWESEAPPLSSNTFARLLLMAHETLEELCFRPPWSSDDLEGYEAPSFSSIVLPVLQILSFRILHLSLEEDRSMIMQRLDSLFAVFPSCPRLQRLEFTFYLTESREIDQVSAFGFLDWHSLLEERYPSWKVLEFEMMMESEEHFDDAERKRVETVVRQSIDMVDCDKFVMRWSPTR